MDFDEFVATERSQIEAELAGCENDADPMPHMVVEMGEGGIAFFALPDLGSDAKGEHQEVILPAALLMNDAQAFALSFAAWWCEGDDPEGREPKDRPDRKECVTVFAADRERERMMHLRFDRDGDGRPTGQHWEDDESSGHALGPMIDPLRAAMQAIAAGEGQEGYVRRRLEQRRTQRGRTDR